MVGVVPFWLMRDTSLSGSVRESLFSSALICPSASWTASSACGPKAAISITVSMAKIWAEASFSCLPQPDRHRVAANMSMKHRFMASSDSV